MPPDDGLLSLTTVLTGGAVKTGKKKENLFKLRPFLYQEM